MRVRPRHPPHAAIRLPTPSSASKGFGITATDDGVFVFTRPDGSRITACGILPNETKSRRFRGIVGGGEPLQTMPRHEPLLDDAAPGASALDDAALEAFDTAIRYHHERLTSSSNASPSPKIDGHTARCKWLGERMDYSTAIESMQFREEAAKAKSVAPS